MLNLPRRVMPVLAALPLAFAACGGGDSDEDKIKAIIKEGDSKPESICDNASKALLEQLGGKDKCLEAAKAQGNEDDPSTIKSVKIDGDKATVDLTDKDGAQSVKFVKEDGDWKVAAQ